MLAAAQMAGVGPISAARGVPPRVRERALAARHARMRLAAIGWLCGRAVRWPSVSTMAEVSPQCGPVVSHARGCCVGALKRARTRKRMAPRTMPFLLLVGRASLVCAVS